MSSVNKIRRMTACVLVHLLFITSVLGCLQVNAGAAYAIPSEQIVDEQPIRRLKQNDVLDTWKYYYCFTNPTRHNNGPKDMTYKSLAFKNSYARGKDKTLYHIDTYGRCGYSHSGAEYTYQATYYTW